MYVKTNWADDITPISAEKMNKIEQGISSLDRVMGTYTGNDIATRTINLGFTPSAVLLLTQKGEVSNGVGGLALNGYGVILNTYPILTINSNGFVVYYDPGTPKQYSNYSAQNVYRYIALK